MHMISQSQYVNAVTGQIACLYVQSITILPASSVQHALIMRALLSHIKPESSCAAHAVHCTLVLLPGFEFLVGLG